MELQESLYAITTEEGALELRIEESHLSCSHHRALLLIVDLEKPSSFKNKVQIQYSILLCKKEVHKMLCQEKKKTKLSRR